MLTKIQDLAYELDGAGNVQLEQGAGYGDVSRVELHLSHVRILAELVGLLPRDPAASLPQSFVERRLLLIADRMDGLCDSVKDLDLQPYEQPIDMARVIRDDIAHLLEDLGTPPDIAFAHEKKTQTEPTANPPVTQQKPTGNPVGSSAGPLFEQGGGA